MHVPCIDEEQLLRSVEAQEAGSGAITLVRRVLHPVCEHSMLRLAFMRQSGLPARNVPGGGGGVWLGLLQGPMLVAVGLSWCAREVRSRYIEVTLEDDLWDGLIIV